MAYTSVVTEMRCRLVNNYCLFYFLPFVLFTYAPLSVNHCCVFVVFIFTSFCQI